MLPSSSQKEINCFRKEVVSDEVKIWLHGNGYSYESVE